MTSAASVKARLKNLAVAEGKSLQELLTLYGLERTVYRLSKSDYNERFSLKGGIFLYALFKGDFVRATNDIDLLAGNVPNNVENIKKIFEGVFSIECDDALRYDLSTLHVKEIVEVKEYHGVNVSITAYLDRTRVPVSIDIGFDDVIYPGRLEMEFPTILDMAAPTIYAYSIYSVIAEKFEAIVSLGDVNSRYKDFYDIYMLACKYEMDGEDLKEAIQCTFNHRGTGFHKVFAFEDDFVSSEIHQHRWNAFVKKKRAMVEVGLEDVIRLLKSLLLPIIDSIVSDSDEYEATWNHVSLAWE